MKNLFTLLSIGQTYTKYSLKLVKNLLDKTPHDIRISTNCPEYYSGISPRRICVNDISEKLKFNNIGLGGFNYNLKFYAFENIPTTYDSIFYLDCDQEVVQWDDDKFNNILTNFFNDNKDFICTRTNAILGAHMKNYRIDKHPDLFSHKMENYELTYENTPEEWLNASMPSEHFLIFKNDQNKIKKFHFTWKMLNALSEQRGDKNQGTWGDGFEIGISAKNAGFNAAEVAGDIQAFVFGIKFNGNKNEN